MDKSKLINDYKKSNKVRREKIALKAGFKTGEEYLQSLLTITPQKAIKVAKTKKMTGIFYVIDVLDASGSMGGGKYENSQRGIIDGIKDMAVRKDVKYSLVEFVQSNRGLNKPIVQVEPSLIKTSDIRFSGAVGGDTPLYYAVYETIKSIQPRKEDKVLINVYTDGGDNAKREYKVMAAKLIEEVQKENFTITFVATPTDLAQIKADINIKDSNTLAVTNDAAGFKKAMLKTRSSKANYFASSLAGMNTLVGFYKEEGTL